MHIGEKTYQVILTLQIDETSETKIVDVVLLVEEDLFVSEEDMIDRSVKEYARRNLPGMSVVRYKWTEF